MTVIADPRWWTAADKEIVMSAYLGEK